MIADSERRAIAARLRASVARELREMAYRERFEGSIIARIIGAPYSGTVRYDHDAWYRLADMVEPDPDICSVCPERKLGAAEERQAQAIARHVVREVEAIACDRDALLALADECDRAYRVNPSSAYDEVARRIREALGVA